jgi:hypothetical protein
MKPNDSPPALVRAVVACVVLGALMVSCGDDDDDSASTAAATPATPFATAGSTGTATTAPAAESSAPGSSTAPSGDVCADREALRTSVDALTNLDVVAEGTNGLTAAVGDVKDALAALRSSAGSELQPQVQAVQDAVDELETAVPNIDSGGAAAAVTAVADVATSAQTLLDSLEAGACGASTTSTT